MSTSGSSPSPARVSEEQLPLNLAILLHILPGVLTILFFIFVGRHIASFFSFPTRFGYSLAHGLILIPFELGLLLYLGKKRNRTFSLKGIVLYTRSLPWRELIPVVACLVIGTAVWVQIQTPLDVFFFNRFFSWLPTWFLMENSAQGFSGSALLVTYLLGFVLTGFIGPLTEELYFHGYLLPRLSRFGLWAPVINSALFMAYHFHDPWRYVSRIMLAVPLAIAIQRKRSINFAIGFHCIGNIVGEMSAIAAIWPS